MMLISFQADPHRSNTIDAEFEDDFKLSSGTALDRFDARPDMRTFVFSATMSKDMQRNLKKRSRYIEPGETTDDMSSLGEFVFLTVVALARH